MTRTLGVAAIVAVSGAVLFAAERSGSSYTVRAMFRDAAGLRGHSQVKLGGVRVGTVSKLVVAPGDTALVTMTLNHAKVGPGARAYVRPVNLLGEKYVDLQPGDLGRPQPSGTLIPLARTGTPVEIDQVLDTLDATTRFRLRVLIDESGQALVGRGLDFGRTLSSLPPALDQAQALVGAFARDNEALGRLVDESDRVVGAIASKRRALGALVHTTGGVLGAVARRDAELGGTVRQAAPAFAQLRSTLARLQVSARALGPAADGLRATAPGLTSTLRALPAFTAAARPTLRTAERVAPSLTRLGVQATPVVTRLRPVAARLNDFATAFDPVTTTLDRGVDDLLGYLEGWARAIQVGDGASHMFRNQLVLSPEVVERLAGYLRPGRSRRQRSSLRLSPAVPQVRLPQAPTVKKLTSDLEQVAGSVRGHVEQLVSGSSPVPDQGQVSKLLGYLLGP
jgi:virulence factor Mce-like protein